MGGDLSGGELCINYYGSSLDSRSAIIDLKVCLAVKRSRVGSTVPNCLVTLWNVLTILPFAVSSFDRLIDELGFTKWRRMSFSFMPLRSASSIVLLQSPLGKRFAIFDEL